MTTKYDFYKENETCKKMKKNLEGIILGEMK